MTDQETVEFVHQALFRASPADISEAINDYLANALFETASRGSYGIPAPLGRPDARWMFSGEVKSWIEDNRTSIKHDLAMHVSTAFQPVAPTASKPKRR
ncbi:MAG: hypothetical protein IAG13_32350 [Deltaproteobacteria bacterium]|nr:hypothetical protein [Nannocystaceae bacterium]